MVFVVNPDSSHGALLERIFDNPDNDWSFADLRVAHYASFQFPLHICYYFINAQT